jgi:hypothetical protein
MFKIKMTSAINFFGEDGYTLFNLNPAFIKAIEAQGYKNIKKLGEGNSNIALLADFKRERRVLLINKNIGCFPEVELSEGYELILNLQKKKKLNNSIVKIFEPLVIEDIAVCEDAEYCEEDEPPLENFVEVEEYIDGISLNEYIFKVSKEDFYKKISFLRELQTKTEEMLAYLKSKDLYYWDFNPTNLMLRDPDDLDTLTLIDVDSFKSRKGTMKDKKMTNEEFDQYIRRSISLDFYERFLDPMSEEEEDIEEQKIVIKLFDRYEIGHAFGIILAGFFPVIKEEKVEEEEEQEEEEEVIKSVVKKPTLTLNKTSPTLSTKRPTLTLNKTSPPLSRITSPEEDFYSHVKEKQQLQVKVINASKWKLKDDYVYNAMFDTNYSDVGPGKHYDEVRILLSSKNNDDYDYQFYFKDYDVFNKKFIFVRWL